VRLERIANRIAVKLVDDRGIGSLKIMTRDDRR
jgi:hypothetical protein